MNNFRRIIKQVSLFNPGNDGRGKIDGYTLVDLGLPSGILWATVNIQSTTETGYGKYYNHNNAAALATNRGENWSVPTKNNFLELYNNTTKSWVTVNNIKCCKFTSKTNPNAYMLLPVGGYKLSESDSTISAGTYLYYWANESYSSSDYYNFFLLYNKSFSNTYSFSGSDVHSATKTGMPVRLVYNYSN